MAEEALAGSLRARLLRRLAILLALLLLFGGLSAYWKERPRRRRYRLRPHPARLGPGYRRWPCHP